MYYTEHNTDRFIRENYFSNFEDKKIMVEVGAGPPDFFSMSKHFRESGWRCICVEPNPKFITQHQQRGHEIYQYACADFEKETIFNIIETDWNDHDNGISYSAIDLKYPLNHHHLRKQIPVKVIKLDTLLEELKIENINFLSVDTEGWELEVMNGFNIEKYNPEIVLLENYLYLESYVEYMKSKNYELDNKIEYNYIFKKIIS